MTNDPVLVALLQEWAMPDTPETRRQIRSTFAYQVRTLTEAARQLRRAAWRSLQPYRPDVPSES